MVLNILLIARFVHHSHWNTAVAIARTAVIAVNAAPLHRCFSGLNSCLNVFVVSYWTFPCPLFPRFRLRFAGVALPCHRIRHGRRQARNS